MILACLIVAAILFLLASLPVPQWPGFVPLGLFFFVLSFIIGKGGL